ncbi:MAG: response regulator [Elusimicrobia bacterium]|nr:response regulator [Elusimicrobiota bacterium]
MASPYRIMVVDDDPAVQGFTKVVLEREGFVVDTCGSITQALQTFRVNRPDLLIIDLGLPDGNGLKLCYEMGLGPRSNIPLLFLTARTDLTSLLACFNIGAQDYIQKPFAVEELLARVKVHLKIKASHDELSKKAYELELKNRVRQELTYMIVHDLKAPLTSIVGTLELFKWKGLISDGNYKKLLDHAGSAADFMLLMLNDLLDIGQAEEVGLKVEVSDIEIDSVINKLKVLFAGRCEKLKVKLETKLSPELKRLKTDQKLIFRILVNLISNGLAVSRAGNQVDLECEPKPKAVRFAVSDRGPGVPDSEKTNIFEKYVTTKKSDEDSGSGIGLTFCRIATQALGGRIWVEDRPGGGSRFILELPR